MANETGKVLAALLGGALAGAAIALLWAPKSGEVLREEIATIAKEKYSHLNKAELSALVDKVMEKLKGGCCRCEADIKEAVEEAVREAEA